jgi:hypothetical protein
MAALYRVAATTGRRSPTTFHRLKFVPFSLNRTGYFSGPGAGCNTPPVAPLPQFQEFARFAGLCGNAKTKITISTTKAAEAE